MAEMSPHEAVKAALSSSELVDTNALTCRIVADRVLDALRAAGYAIVQLPQGDELEDALDDYGLAVGADIGTGLPVRESRDGEGATYRSIGETRSYAAALLAAAELAAGVVS